ncbi:MAG: molybdopterin-binding protein [Peptococcaceae bacterium BRH_c4a]|nr:MAG: molybdopterin-binding protein [Peptococcaceae bacterium BRH_c4a]
MRKVRVEEAVGMVLCHDITRIVPGEFKGPAFRKGDIVKAEDIPLLLELGKEHLYIWECGAEFIHENEAALRIAGASAGEGIKLTDPVEGKVNYLAVRRGLLKVNAEGLTHVNEIEEVILSTRHTNQMVEEGNILAGTRVVPLVIKKEKIERVEEICKNTGPLVQVKELIRLKAGIITTGSEVYHGRIKDSFTPVVTNKLNEYGCPVTRHVMLPDDAALITGEIKNMVAKGVEIVIITGGMSVDPDDVTPAGVRAAGARLVSYGAPVLPGAMFLLAYLEDVPVMGLPACVMYFRSTVFDLVLPRILAGDQVSRKDLARLGHGGLCLGCSQCRFPNCSFGK